MTRFSAPLPRDKGGYFRGTAWAVIGLLEAREVAK
jgi:hypothetical protein